MLELLQHISPPPITNKQQLTYIHPNQHLETKFNKTNAAYWQSQIKASTIKINDMPNNIQIELIGFTHPNNQKNHPMYVDLPPNFF
jgi:hypothetical protein